MAFDLSFALGRRSSNANADPVQNAALSRYALVFWPVIVIVSICAALVGVIAVIVLRNAENQVSDWGQDQVAHGNVGLFYRAARSTNRRHNKLA